MTSARRFIPRALIVFVGWAMLLASPAGAASGPKAPSAVTIAAGAHTGGAPSAMATDDDVTYRVASQGRPVDKVRFIAKYTGLDDEDARLVVRASVSATRDCQASVELYDYGQGRWETVALFPVSPTESDPVFDIARNGYVNSRGVAKARVTCTTNGGDFELRVDMLTAETYTPVAP